MRHLVIGDLHFGTKTNNTQWIKYQTNFFNKQIINLVENEYFDRIIFLGDLTDIRHSINQHIGCELKKCIRKLSITYSKSNPDGKIIFIAGNHDYYSPLNELSEYNSYELLFGEEFCKIYNNIVFVNNKPLLDETSLYVPWYYTETNENVINTINEYCVGNNVKSIYCHTDLSTWDEKICEYLGNIKVYAGHIHHYWKNYNNQLINLCAALPLNFNDVNDKRYIHIIENHEIKSRIENVTTPLFKRIFDEEIFEELEESFFENSFVQLMVNKQKINKANYIERIKEIKKIYGEKYSVSIKLYENVNEFEKIEFSPIQTNINEFIKNNVPDHLVNKYNVVKEQLENINKEEYDN